MVNRRGPWIFVAGWWVWGLAVCWKSGGLPWVSGVVILLGGGLAVAAFRQWRWALRAGTYSVKIWSTAKPGEVMVGAVSCRSPVTDPNGLLLELACCERRPNGQWELWREAVPSPAPSLPGQWPFHFTLPMEAPPTGSSGFGCDVFWALRVRGASTPFRLESELSVLVAKGEDTTPPVPRPLTMDRPPALKRALNVTETPEKVVLSLASPFKYPGPEPLVIWGIAWTAFFIVTTRLGVPLWVRVFAGVLNTFAVLFQAVSWFGREEVLVENQFVTSQGRLWLFRWGQRVPRSSVSGVKVVMSGPGPAFQVKVLRGTMPPLSAWGGFSHPVDAHESARALVRGLQSRRVETIEGSEGKSADSKRH